MNLNTSLTIIAQRFGFNAADLIQFASEDTIGGYHSNPALAKWPMGSLWEVEGKTLYALVRALKPERVLEIGTHRGCSATHMITAIFQQPNTQGELTGCDLGDYGGDLIPESYRPYVEVLHVNGIDYLAEQPDGAFGLIFEDASHDAATTAAVAALAQKKLTPGGVLVVHDAAHFLVGADIRAGLDAANLPGGYGVYLCEPSDCGLAVWRKTPLEITAPEFPHGTAEFQGIPIIEGYKPGTRSELPQLSTPEVIPGQAKMVRKPAPKVKRTPRKKELPQ